MVPKVLDEINQSAIGKATTLVDSVDSSVIYGVISEKICNNGKIIYGETGKNQSNFNVRYKLMEGVEDFFIAIKKIQNSTEIHCENSSYFIAELLIEFISGGFIVLKELKDGVIAIDEFRGVNETNVFM